MSLWQKAYETFEYNAHRVGVINEGQKQALSPVRHMIMSAQIEITINSDGNFVSATSVPKQECKTVIPATYESANRVGDNDKAHPLCDQLRYLNKNGKAKFTAYLAQLERWDASEYSHPKVHAILLYIKSGTILSDLQKFGLNKNKIEGTALDKCVVRWRVNDAPKGSLSAVWQDTELFDAFIKFSDNIENENKTELCMITGEQSPTVQMHPKGVVSSPNGAKLISSNDASGFTYRGRFTDSIQAATIGYVTSQKAHNALQWLVANQGSMQGGRTFVCWNPKGKRVFPCFDPFVESETPTHKPSDYQRQLKATLGGYRNDLPKEEDVVIAAFDAATTGRLSVVYYNELMSSDYYDRIENWYATCCISNGIFGIQSPSFYNIVCSAYGTERMGGKENKERLEVDSRIIGEQMQRLLHCMIDKSPIPRDVVKALRDRASCPMAYKSKENKNKVLFTACAVIRKYQNDLLQKEEWKMVLDTGKHDRSYLFGRLLAVMEYAERSTYEKDEEREPNAIRLQSVFCERPMHTAKIINDSLTPYFQRMSPGKRKFCKNLIGEIFAMLGEEDALKLNLPLGDSYLLGYYLQRNALYTKKEKTEDEKNEHTEE